MNYFPIYDVLQKLSPPYSTRIISRAMENLTLPN